MSNQFKIDALRFKLSRKKKNWNTHPDMSMVPVSNGSLRVLDTKEGKQTLIIIPDGPNVIEHYFNIVAILRKNYRVVIFDLFGLGFSTHTGGYDYSFDKTNNLIDELTDLLKISRPNLVFPCANGFYGLAYARTNPDKVNQLILLQTPTLPEMEKWSANVIPSFLKKPYLSQVIMPFVEKKIAHKWYKYALPKETKKEPFRQPALESLCNGGSYCLCSLTQGLSSERGASLTIDPSIPTTLIYGDSDFTHRPTNFEKVRAYHSKIDIIRFENCGHFPDLEFPNQFIQIIREKIAC